MILNHNTLQLIDFEVEKVQQNLLGFNMVFRLKRKAY